MKVSHFTQICLLVCLALGLFTCEPAEHIKPNMMGSLLLGIELSDNEISNGRISADIKLSVVISIKNELDEFILDQEVLKLTKIKKEYVTKPISLVAGNYEVTDFIIIDQNDEAIYMTPQSGSLLAYLVSTTVPIPFSIEMDNTTKLVPKVISTERKSPKDFGYTSFAFDYQETFDFLIAVFTYDYESDEYELVDATLQVKADGNLVFDSTLYAGTVQVTLPSNHTDYKVLVNKATWKTYSQNFTEEELILHFDESDLGPLQIYLDKGLYLWNKLGSVEELNMSMIGPNLTTTGTPVFAPAKFDNGVYPTYSSEIPTFPSEVFLDFMPNPLLQPWTIEVWFKPDYAVVNNRITTSVPGGRSHIIVANCWRWGPNNSLGGIRIMPIPEGPNYNLPTDVNADIAYYDNVGSATVIRPDVVDNDVSWEIGDLVHIAAVYDPNGIEGGVHFQLFVNGILHCHSNDTGLNDYDTTPTPGWPFKIGGSESWPANGVVDNIKIYDYAKTDFSDKEFE